MLELTDQEFDRIKDIMYKRTGVALKPTKKPLVLTRLRKRLEELSLTRFLDYISLLEKANSPELEYFINAITTNETYFFRHDKQFEYLRNTILPGCLEKQKTSGKRDIRIWSAACSTGEEPYSLAILCAEFQRIHRSTFALYASDVNSEVLKTCKIGRYPDRSFRETPPEIVKKYFKQVQEGSEKFPKTVFEIDATIRKMVEFRQHNLLNAFSVKGIDIVFLRNVMIYFDSPTKQKVVSLIQDVVVPDGYLVISLSESLNDIKSEFQFVQSGIYRKVAKGQV